MNYYEVSILKSPLNLLTFQSQYQIDVGTKVSIKLANRKNTNDAVVIRNVKKPDFKCSDIIDISQYKYDEIMLETSNFISKYYVCSIGEALSLYVHHDTKILNTKSSQYISNNDIVLSNEQVISYKFTSQHKSSLLFANTGSGKTEIYIKAIDDALKNNKQAILLMPEISLTPQMEKRLKKIFGDYVAIWHSKITKKKKEEIISNLASGKIKLIAGARSALFLPYTSLDLIVVDEEHDEAYKANNKPRINVKDISLYMGAKFNLQVILGSATPSISSYYKIPFIRNTHTYFDTNKTINFNVAPLGINQTIINEISNTLKDKKQIIVFLPTRANFKYQICSDCGESIQCPYCSVSLSLHKNNKALTCHYCNYTQPINDICKSCNGLIKNYRLGTAEVEIILKEYFPNNTIEKFDKDSISSQTKLKRILKDFNDSKIDILVGTQMLSKGHDYHNVELAVILGIDSILNMASFRSREKALSLALQISGRSGRKGTGKVIIQTKNKEFFYQFMIDSDYENFLKEELQIRKPLYPPYIRLAKVIFSHTNPTLAKYQLDHYVSIFSTLKNNVELVGYKECEIFKISNKYRYELILRSNDTKSLLDTLHFVNTPLASIDMDITN